jgi:hypothetical protein
MSDVSSVVNFFSTANENFSANLSTGILASATEVPLNHTTTLTDGSVFVGIVEPTGTKQQAFTGTVDLANSQIKDVVWTRGSNVGHDAGVLVVDYVTGTDWNMLVTGILKFANQDGSLKEVSGSWVAYTPTLTNITLGNGTLTGRYKQIGKLVFFEVTLTFGSTTTLATVANYTQSPRFSLPVTGHVSSWTCSDLANYNGAPLPCAARLTYDASAASGSGSAAAPQWYDSDNFCDTALSSASANFHDVGDKGVWSGCYEAA